MPITEGVKGHFELQMKDKQFGHEIELKRRDLQSRVDNQFLTLAISKELPAEDKKRILDVLANYAEGDTSLRSWAKVELDSIKTDIDAIRRLSDSTYTATVEINPEKRASLIAANNLEWAQHHLLRASHAGDRVVVERFAREVIPTLRGEADRLAVIDNSRSAAQSNPVMLTLQSGKKLADVLTPEVVSELFPGASLENIKRNLPYVFNALQEFQIADPEMALVALSTIRVETSSFQPISEFISRFNTSPGGQPFDLYDNRKDLGNQGPPDGARYKGRGFLAVAGRANYAALGKALGLDLLENPDQENFPDVAAKSLAYFLKQNEQRMRSAIRANDLHSVRRFINGGSHGLPVFVETFQRGKKALQ